MPDSNNSRVTAIGGMPSEEDIILVGPGCQMSCTFCPHSGGRAGHPIEKLLAPDFQLPLAHRVTILAGDVVRADLAPVVERLRRQGTTDVFIYATPGTWDIEALDALATAGLTGLHLMLPAAGRELLSTLTGGKGSLGLLARLVQNANRRGLRIAAEIPVVQASATAVHDTVERFLKIAAVPDRVVLRFLAEFHPTAGPQPWDQSLAAPSVSRAAAICREHDVPMLLAHPEAPPPCIMEVCDASSAMYPGLNMTGFVRRAARPFKACETCRAVTVCTAGARFMATEEPQLAPALSADNGYGPATPQQSACNPNSTPATVIWRRQAELGRLRAEIIDRKLACRYPWEQLEAHDIRGVVTPCAGGWPLERTLDDCVSWHNTSLLEAWNSPAMQNVRRAVAGGDPMATCKPECPAFHGGPQNAVPGMAAPTTAVMFENMVKNCREMLDGATVLQSRPQSISFSPTLRCTNRCRMCDIHEVMEVMGKPAQVREMPDTLFNELMELLPTTRMLALTGGEPLISRRMRHLLMEFRADRYPDGAVTITTNGQLLRESLLKDLSKTRIKLFYVSLNAADDAMYEHISGIPGGYTRVRTHLQMLMDMAPHMAGRPGVVTSFVVMRSNFRQLPAFLELALGLKVGIRLLPIERDRLGESIFTDEPTLREVHDLMTQKVMPDMNRRLMPWGYRAEIMKLFSVIDSRLQRAEFKPL